MFIRFLVGLAALLVILSLYRAYLDYSSFLESFDKLSKVVVNETWKVISTPTVFLVLLLAFVLIASPLGNALSKIALSKITIGNLTAEFSQQALAGVEKEVKDTISAPPRDQSTFAASTKQEIVANLREDFCFYLLQVANKPLDLLEHTRLISHHVFHRGSGGEGLPAEVAALLHGVKTFEASGFLRALYQFNGLVFRFGFEHVGGKLLLNAKVESDVLDLIRKRVGKEPSDDRPVAKR